MLYTEILWLALKIALGVFVLLNAYVTVRLVIFAGYSWRQKLWQLCIIWFVPIIGSVLVHSLIAPPKWKEPDLGFSKQPEDPPGAGLGGG